ncbi:tyrosine-protein kinase family protein [Glaciecola sp. MH2013]|uniref:XrtA-associated tyrosine autokinase n=1 Tax=Glaciecola sp. MH2013 TaxID=2785524 RepID=UPI00189D6925|nr:XrtA-associated tyrosine autokinase [Glaciecola sp. MH2013]MBF7072147.1 tyrosine-protein kinase family protein [Glaciecola sp. MH2013]
MSNTIEKALLRQQEAERAQRDISGADGNGKGDRRSARRKVVIEPDKPEMFTDKRFEIDLERLEERGFVSPNSTRSLINEEYREIKRKLLANAFGALSGTINNSNIIMVTSARPSEGKTFTAVNLAISIAAEQDKRVLLVDADVLKPNTLRTLGLNERSGLMEYLLGEKEEIGEVMFRTNLNKLRLIPAGRSHHLSTELLASEAMSDLIDEFSNRYPDRIVIIDTPPLIGINESAILANFAGQAVVVVEEGRSKLADVKKAVDRLNPDMAIGYVINKSVSQSDSNGYYGYSYYGNREEAGNAIDYASEKANTDASQGSGQSSDQGTDESSEARKQ